MRRSRAGKRRRSLPQRLLRLAAAVVVGLYVSCVLLLVAYRWVDPPVTGVQLERRVEALLAGEKYQPRQEQISLEQTPVVVQHAVIAAEDGAFYDHDGFDWAELEKVVDESRRGKRMRGASTISQQLVKNLFFTTDRSLVRKAGEYALTPVAELVLSKDRILEIYLNVIEWGPGVWGVQAAAQHHYGKPASALSREEAARLAACIPAPRSRRPERMNDYGRIILERMSSRGW